MSGILIFTISLFLVAELAFFRQRRNCVSESSLPEAKSLVEFMNNIPLIGYIKDLDGRYLYGNRALEQLLKAGFGQIRGTTALDWLEAKAAEQVRQTDSWVVEYGPRHDIVENVEDPGGGFHSWLILKFPFQDQSGHRLIGGVAFDVTEEMKLKRQLVEQLALSEKRNGELSEDNRRLIEMASTDGLTRLLNTRNFRERVSTQLSLARRTNRPLSLMMIDVDHFKSFNDTFGHQAGDEALVEVARLLRINARDPDVVARYGGEEFAVLLPETTHEGGLIVAERLRKAVMSQEWPLRPITISIGLASIGAMPTTAEYLIKQADENLYKAKNLGRNQVVAEQTSTRYEHLAEAR